MRPELIFLLSIAHWYMAFFCHSFFQHRYADHQQFTMSKSMEKFWFIVTWVSQGATYLSPTAYGIMHRVHHAYTDTEKDPHSPLFTDGLLGFYKKTKSSYLHYLYKEHAVDEKFTRNIPRWKSFDQWAYSKSVRFGWIVIYVAL